jgi:hypothetical protein
LGILSFLVLEPPAPRAVAVADSQWVLPDEVDSLSIVVADVPVQRGAAPDQVTNDIGGGSLGRIPFVTGARERDPGAALSLTEFTSTANPAGDGSLPLGESVLPVGGGDGNVDTAGDGQGIGNGVGDGSGTSFFGLDAAGKKFVFVVDASGSMRRPFAGPGKTLLGRVKMELLSCITQMSPDQEFFIVFFNDEAIPMPARHLVKATPEAQKHFLYWMAETKAGGNTEPEDALKIAMQLEPDVVYFLTDGAFKYRVIGHVREYNRSDVIVHTVSFGGDERAADFMKQIASQNGGTYHFVSSQGEAPNEETADADVETTVTRSASVPVE